MYSFRIIIDNRRINKKYPNGRLQEVVFNTIKINIKVRDMEWENE